AHPACTQQNEHSDPDALIDQGAAWHALVVQLTRRLEKEPVAGHGIRHPRTRQNQPVIAAKGGNNDRYRHDNSACRSKNRSERGGGDPVVWGILNLRERKRAEVSEVGQAIQSDHDQCSKGHRERNIAFGILHLCSGEANVVPGVSRKERAYLRHAVSREEPKCTGSGGHRGDKAAQKTCAGFKRLRSTNGPEVAEVIGDSRSITANKDAYKD